MKPVVSDKLQDILNYASARAQEWREAARRADDRGEPALATYYRNEAWRITNGREWLDATAGEPNLPPNR